MAPECAIHISMNNPESSTPWWETAIMAGSFVLIWVWYLARQAAYRSPNGSFSILWQVPLIVALVALIVVTVRRVKRVQRALRGDDEVHGQFPVGFTSVNGNRKK